jgi:hypothetical protein
MASVVLAGRAELNGRARCTHHQIRIVWIRRALLTSTPGEAGGTLTAGKSRASRRGELFCCRLVRRHNNDEI